MTFRDPRLLWLLAVIPFAALFLIARERLRARLARRFVAERLRGVTNPVRPVRPWLLAAGAGLALLALSGPSRGFVTIPIMERESNRVLILDVSNSMLAADLGTSRLAVAKAIAHRLIDSWPGRVGLVEFEGAPEVVSPLTSDSDAVASLLDSIEAGEVGTPGTDIGSALDLALRLVEVEPGAKADVIVISDGEDQGKKLDDAIRRAKERGVTISTILIGTGNGSTIPTPDGHGPLHDESGQIVTTFAHGDTLKKISAATGGSYFENPAGEHTVDSLLAPRTSGTAKEKKVRIPVDRYQWPLALAFLALFVGSIANRGAE